MAECNTCGGYLSIEDKIRLSMKCDANGNVVWQGALLKQTAIIPEGFTHPMFPSGIAISINSGVASFDTASINDYRKALETPVIKYLDPDLGLDTNNGDTWETAYKTYTKLLATTYDRAYIRPDHYAATGASLLGVDRETISVGGQSVLTRGYLGSGLTWTDLGGGSFSAPMTGAVVKVIDMSGDTAALTLVASAELVASTANSWFRNTTTNVIYVHLTAGTAPDKYIHFSLGIYTFAAGRHCYLENITTLGVNLTINTTSTVTKFNAKGCKFLHNYTSNCLSATGNCEIWLQDCESAYSNEDALNYHGASTYNPAVVEVNCICRNTGIGSGTDFHNGSTSHEASRIIRLNGQYYNTKGPCVHEVNMAISLNICCSSGESNSSVEDSKSSWAVAIGDNVNEAAKMYLQNCTGGTATTKGAESRSSYAAIYVHNSTITNIEEGTTLIPY